MVSADSVSNTRMETSSRAMMCAKNYADFMDDFVFSDKERGKKLQRIPAALW
jgi:hypothetical protein